MKTNLLRVLSIIAVAGLISPSTYSQDEVGMNIIDRASRIAIAAGGDGTTIKSVQRVQNLPGLRQATLVIYTDASGNLANLVMLPDGKHFIAGPIGAFDEKSDSIGPVNQQSIPHPDNQNKLDAAATKPVKTEAFKLDGILRPSNFSTAGIELFSDPLKAPAYFIEILASAKGIEDGKMGKPVYVLFDPACGYCQLEYNQLRPLIDSEIVKVYWIPVIGPSPAPYTDLIKLIDPGSDNETRLKRLKVLMAGENISEEAKDEAGAKQLLERTTTLLSLLRSERSPDKGVGTPQTFYIDNQGVIRHEYGFSDNLAAKLKTLLN